jgi:ribosomal protein S18 acetylase RimI-like enzyme
MAVAEPARGLGLGSALLQELEALARKAGAGRVVLNAREDAQRFYEKNGYVVTGPAPTIFSAVNHMRMAKQLRS